MDDEWRDISHHRVVFKPYESMLQDPTSAATFKAWPKPLTIEFLEEQYRKWMTDLTSFCWIDEPVRELGASTGNPGMSSVGGHTGIHEPTLSDKASMAQDQVTGRMH